jgi:lysophospholipase L1-like esterase
MLAFTSFLGDSLKRFALLLVAALALAGCASEPPAPSQRVQEYWEANKTFKPLPTRQVVKAAPLTFGPGTKTVFFGDSWTTGLFMKPESKGYAYLTGETLGLDFQVLGGNGTGYLNAGSNGQGSYGERFTALPSSDAQLLIIQGSVNDFGRKSSDLGPAFDETIETAREKFPAAQLVVIGPSTAQWPVPPSIYPVNDILHERSDNAGIAYISPYEDQWITAENFPTVIDPATGHPSEQGHAYLASKVSEALKAKQAQ